MKRKIVGFHLDESNDWVAELDCHHGQHMRHNPTFQNRPWINSKEGRDNRLGEAVECLKCDRLEFPTGLTAYKKTKEFTEKTVPEGLKRDHSIKDGAWGLLHVVAGSLIYVVDEPVVKQIQITSNQSEAIPPSVLHHVIINDEVTFYIEFYSK